MSCSITALLESRALLFWDFDGVIKDSLDIKTEAFDALFRPYGADVADRVTIHHKANGGISRLRKIPLYLGWAGLSTSKENVEAFCERFSELVLQRVIESPWVPGVREYLIDHRAKQACVLVTATPQEEIDAIVSRLGIATCFRRVVGAPTAKPDAIAKALASMQIAGDQALMIGDTATDLQAAQANGVGFLLRCTPLNKDLQGRFAGPNFESLTP